MMDVGSPNGAINSFLNISHREFFKFSPSIISSEHLKSLFTGNNLNRIRFVFCRFYFWPLQAINGASGLFCTVTRKCFNSSFHFCCYHLNLCCEFYLTDCMCSKNQKPLTWKLKFFMAFRFSCIMRSYRKTK